MELEQSYELFEQGLIEKESFKESILAYAYNQAGRDKYIEPGDFILDFIPKVDSIIKNYNPILASFKHYINKHIKWLMFSFNKQYAKNKEKSDAYQYHYIAEFKDNLCLSEESVEYKISDVAKNLLSIENGEITKNSLRKRLEIFTLKNSRNLTSQQIDILAPLIGRTSEWLFSVKEQLDKNCYERIENREYLQLRHNRLFIEITRDQKKLTEMDEGYEKDLLFSKMQDKQRRKHELNIKLTKRNCGPKNEEIALMLDIPKGTVDSSLFYIKKTLLTLLPELLID